MSSLRRHEGLLVIDNRDSPGVARDLLQSSGKDVPFVQASTLYESATYTCSHCQTVVIINPTRTRERGYCRKCDHVICDACSTLMARTFECVPFKKILDDAQEAAERAQRGSLILP